MDLRLPNLLNHLRRHHLVTGLIRANRTRNMAGKAKIREDVSTGQE